MQDLRLIGVHEDGLHLLLTGPDGEHFTVAIDDALRTAARRDRPRMGQLQIDLDGGLRPREVQSLIRAGGSTEEVADRAGWSVDKVHRYEGPILAERAHVADQARLVRVRHRGGSAAGPTPTLQGRVSQRMRERGVDPDTSTWDAWRSPEAASWTVALTFAAGGRQRQASWVYDPVLRTVEAVDDEARWLSADDVPASGPLPATPARAASVYDVEAEGGVAATTTHRATRDRTSGAAPAGAAGGAGGAGEGPDEPVDLMTAMRQRTTVGRRSGRRRAEPRAHVAPSLPLDEATESAETAVASPPPPQPPQPPASVTEPSTPGHVEPALTEELGDLEPAGSEVPPLDEPEMPVVPEGADGDDSAVSDDSDD
ncbi:MAG: septation protein SepH, partial [Lapillicoccus sp.]